MLERVIEKMLFHRVKERGGMCPKFTSPGTAGMPDRLVIMPGNKLGLIEVKAPGGKPRPLQEHRLQQLHDLGAKAYVLDSPDLNEINRILDEISAS